MKKTPLTRKPFAWKPKHKKKGKGLFDHLKTESKDEEWNRIREELKVWFTENGILSCELKLEGCTKAENFGWTWSFAHSKKRGEIVAQKVDPIQREIEMKEVVYACGSCHNTVEKIGNKVRLDNKPTMRDFVVNAINKRGLTKIEITSTLEK
jgi:hypothetical protein